jgi:hypothetical protein
MKLCENCQIEHDETYGSGRFCSSKCAHGFSSKEKRKEINEKVSKKLSSYKHANIKLTCKNCETEFEVDWAKRKRQFCSKKCTYEYMPKNEQFRNKMSKIRVDAMERGIVNGYGIHCIYGFNGKSIRCDSKLEYFVLMNLCKQYEVISIDRNTKIKTKYLNCQNQVSTFIPDFVVKTTDLEFLVEVKSSNLAPFLGKRWQHYIENARIKRQVLDIVAEQNGLIPLWLTNSTYPGYNVFKL